MSLDNLKSKLEELKENLDTRKRLEFVSMLRKDHSNEVIDFHYNTMFLDLDYDLINSLRGSFRFHKKDGEQYLLSKLNKNIDKKELAESIHLLGELRSKEVIPYCYKSLEDDEYDLRYRSIIVLGWVGSEKDIELLKDHMYTEQETKLIGYCATAMRQIWYRLPNTKDQILKIYKEALETIINKEVLPYILICIQDLLNIKLGIKEDVASLHYEDDIEAIKEKGVSKINNYFK